MKNHKILVFRKMDIVCQFFHPVWSRKNHFTIRIPVHLHTQHLYNIRNSRDPESRGLVYQWITPRVHKFSAANNKLQTDSCLKAKSFGAARPPCTSTVHIHWRAQSNFKARSARTRSAWNLPGVFQINSIRYARWPLNVFPRRGFFLCCSSELTIVSFSDSRFVGIISEILQVEGLLV